MRFYKRKTINILRRLIFFVFLFNNAFAQQVKGIVYDEKNEPLPFVSVSVDGTGIGTSSNLSGAYSLGLKNGSYTLTFRCVGYTTIKKEIIISGQDLKLDVVLPEQLLDMKPYYFTKNGEDPAYGIIRKAQKKRKSYLNQVKDYQYESYIKGSAFLRNAPEKIMGQDIFLDGLDSTRSGMIYLSESVSKVYVHGMEEKEIMVSSKVAGRSQGFSWNSALEFQLNFYENLVPTPVTDRNVVSPIATDAMTYYRYKLLGEYIDHGRTIYRIEVKPKLTGSPLVNGVIEIQDSTWRIHAIDIFVTKENGMDFLDTLNMKVIFVPITNDIWLKGTQQFDFKFTFNLFKIKGDGHFLGSFNNYVIDPVFEKNFFSGEVVKVNEESNKKSDAYWDSIRPVPLTTQESADYELKDSLEELHETKSYMDSLDRKRNRFKVINLVSGYTWNNSYHRIELHFSSPLMVFHFNTVEGIVLSENISFEKYFKEQKSQINADVGFRYGFSDGRFFIKGGFRYRFNATNRWFMALDGGHYISQFNGEVMPELHNSLYTIFLEINHWRLYEKNFIKFTTGGEIVNGLRMRYAFEADHRKTLNNANPLTPFFIDNSNRSFGANDDFKNPGVILPAAPGWFLTNILTLTYTPGQKYMMRPKLKLPYPTKWPTFGVTGRLTFVQIDGSPNTGSFAMGEFFLEQDIDLGILGNSEYYASAGYFFKRPVYFFGYQHFATTQTAFAPRDELRSFWTLPYYQASTNDWFVQAHYQHHFKGLLLGKIPGIKKAKIYEVVGFHFLYNPVIRDYYEFTIGFENILRVFRVDFVGGFIRGEAPMFGGRIKIRI